MQMRRHSERLAGNNDINGDSSSFNTTSSHADGVAILKYWFSVLKLKMVHALQINSAGVQNMASRSNAQTFQNRTVCLQKNKKYEEKQKWHIFTVLTTELFTGTIGKKKRETEKWHQRHNLTVLSQLPVARSSAVG